MMRAAIVLFWVGAGCASQWDLDQANARARLMRARQHALEQRIATLEAELVRRPAMPPAEARRARQAPPVEHVVVVRVETVGGVETTVDLDPAPAHAPAGDDDRRVPRIEDELISPWPREGAATERPDVGTLRIGAEGFFCAASVDGIPVGNTPIAIRTVRVGPHDVTCSNPSLAYEQTKSVSVERGERTIVRFAR